MELFNGRALTEAEARFHADRRCICCGVRVPLLGTDYVPMECHACYRTRTGVWSRCRNSTDWPCVDEVDP